MQKSILIADDDAHIREILTFALEKAGFQVVVAQHGKEAVEKALRLPCDLLVLDINMPEIDGLEVCRRLRKTSDIPILFLSSRDEEIDRVVGLEIGGDDYLTKPFSPRELVARVQAILKRTLPKAAPPPAAKGLHKSALRADTESYSVFWHNTPVALTATEFQLLVTLLRHPEKVFQREELMDSAYQGLNVSDRTIDSHIRRIRQKFTDAGAPSVIETVHGIGYKLGTCQ
jgi:two-component system OmpR family response regulator